MERVKTGVKGLDDMLAGGFLPSSVNLVKGAPGTGKTTLGIEFIVRGNTVFNEPGLIVTFEQFPDQLNRDAASFGFDLPELERKGRLKVIFSSPQTFIEEMAEPGGAFDRVVAELGVRRVFLDSVTHLERLGEEGSRLRERVYAFINGLKRFGTTVLMTQEDKAITGDLSAAGYGLSYMVDTIIQLRYVELDSVIAKALFVIKQRASDHDKSIRQYQLTDKGMSIEAPFTDRQGVLSGSPSRFPEEAFIRAFSSKKK